jgi:hypothetical protein
VQTACRERPCTGQSQHQTSAHCKPPSSPSAGGEAAWSAGAGCRVGGSGRDLLYLAMKLVQYLSAVMTLMDDDGRQV